MQDTMAERLRRQTANLVLSGAEVRILLVSIFTFGLFLFASERIFEVAMPEIVHVRGAEW